jgi:hypothetical protein
LHLGGRLHPGGCLHFLPLLPLLSLRSGLCLDWRLHLGGCLRFLSLLSLFSLGSGLRLDRSLGLNLNWSCGRRRLNLRFAPASTFALPPVSLPPASLSLVSPGLFLPRVGRPVLMLAAAAIVWLRPCCARNQNGNSSPNRKRFHRIIQSPTETRAFKSFGRLDLSRTCMRAGGGMPPVFGARI